MLHPSYTDLINAVNSEVEPGEQPVVQSRYSIVLATSSVQDRSSAEMSRSLRSSRQKAAFHRSSKSFTRVKVKSSAITMPKKRKRQKRSKPQQTEIRKHSE